MDEWKHEAHGAPVPPSVREHALRGYVDQIADASAEPCGSLARSCMSKRKLSSVSKSELKNRVKWALDPQVA